MSNVSVLLGYNGFSGLFLEDQTCFFLFLYQKHIYNFVASICLDLMEILDGTIRANKKLFGCGTLGDYLITLQIWM